MTNLNIIEISKQNKDLKAKFSHKEKALAKVLNNLPILYSIFSEQKIFVNNKYLSLSQLFSSFENEEGEDKAKKNIDSLAKNFNEINKERIFVRSVGKHIEIIFKDHEINDKALITIAQWLESWKTLPLYFFENRTKFKLSLVKREKNSATLVNCMFLKFENEVLITATFKGEIELNNPPPDENEYQWDEELEAYAEVMANAINPASTTIKNYEELNLADGFTMLMLTPQEEFLANKKESTLEEVILWCKS